MIRLDDVDKPMECSHKLESDAIYIARYLRKLIKNSQKRFPVPEEACINGYCLDKKLRSGE